jgi:hypothetical protein
MMKHSDRPCITFLSFAQDPSQQLAPFSDAHKSTEKQGSVVRALGKALSQVGWQVTIFTAKQQPGTCETVWIAPHCQVVRIPVETAPVADQAQRLAYEIESFQARAGLVWPLFHSFDTLSACTGEQLKHEKGWRWVHTSWRSKKSSLEEALETSADQVLRFQMAQTTVTDRSHELRQIRNQRFGSIYCSEAFAWRAIATQLSTLYRKHLAIYVGATGIETSQVCDLRLPANVEENQRTDVINRPLAEPQCMPQYAYSA